MSMFRHQPTSAAEARKAVERTSSMGIVRTPLVRLNAPEVPVEIFLKLESLQPIGSFKIRGMANALAQADRVDLAEGVWTVSAGNAAQGLAWSALRLGVGCTVVVPESAPMAKLVAIDQLGASIIQVPFDEWLKIPARRSFDGLDGLFIHPFSDAAVMAGNGTIALEVVSDLPEAAAVLIPWGGGGLSCGIAAVLRELAPHMAVYACEFSPSAPLHASLVAGKPTTVPYAPSFVDGIGAPLVFPEMFELAQRVLDGSLVVSLDETRRVLKLLAERNHVISEGAGAVPVAAAMRGELTLSGAVVCIVSGGNIDVDKLTRILSEDPAV